MSRPFVCTRCFGAIPPVEGGIPWIWADGKAWCEHCHNYETIAEIKPAIELTAKDAALKEARTPLIVRILRAIRGSVPCPRCLELDESASRPAGVNDDIDRLRLEIHKLVNMDIPLLSLRARDALDLAARIQFAQPSLTPPGTPGAVIATPSGRQGENVGEGLSTPGDA